MKTPEHHTVQVLTTVAAADGTTHFEEVDVPMHATLGALRSEPLAAAWAGFVIPEVDPNPTTHPAPRNQFVVVLAGTVEIECGDGATRRLGPGGLLHVQDTTGPGHFFRVIETPLKIMNIALGPEAQPSARRLGQDQEDVS